MSRTTSSLPGSTTQARSHYVGQGIRASRKIAVALVFASGALLVLGMCIGSTGFESVLALYGDPAGAQIVWEIRLPRTVGAWLTGALLGLSGAVAQGLFRNPLADPYLLGSASGAALGTAVALTAAGSVAAGIGWAQRFGMTGMAFVGAVAAVLLTLALARGVHNTLRLLLAGVIVGVVCGAVRDLLELAYPDILQPMKAFVLGSTVFLDWSACIVLAVSWLASLVIAAAFAKGLDGLVLGEQTASSLGLPMPWIRAGLIMAMALATGSAVAQAGLIAFIGLAAPHVVRSLCQVGHARSVALSSGMGGLLLLAADIVARFAVAPEELPVGVLTALLGGTYLLWRMHRQRHGGAF
jgi:iron complex transport system permease protein